MAKLSVYKTIDRSQLGGKFVPLIHSGVNNYKILASDLGKEYSPGDAIEITDTGEINVKFRPDDFDVSSGSLIIKTDESRGVFKGTDGIYIASADDSIGISRTGIKVNPESFVGSGLSYHKHRLSVNAKTPLRADDNGLSLLIGGAGLEIVSGCLYLDSSVVSHTAADAVYYYMSTRTGSSLSIDQGYLVVDTNYIASAGLTTGLGNYNPISVDIKYVANAIGNSYIGSGLYWDNNNYTLSANVNTATGIIVQDNRLYLNAGAGLHTTNNTVKVKAADNTINVSSAGIGVNKSALSIPTSSSLAGPGLEEQWGILYVKSADSSIYVNSDGIKVNADALSIPTSDSLAGRGLRAYGSKLYVQSADDTINVSESGIKVNTSVLPTASSLAGFGLHPYGSQLYVKPADKTIDLSPLGIKVRYGSGLTKDSAGYLVSALYAGSGVKLKDNYISLHAGAGLYVTGDDILYVKSADGSIGVSSAGIKVNTGYGLSATSDGLYVKSADDSIGVTGSGIGVKLRSKGGIALGHDGLYFSSGVISSALAGEGLDARDGALYVKTGPGLGIDSYGYIYSASSTAGPGLKLHSDGYLQVKSSDGSIFVTDSGISVDLRNAEYIGSGLTTQGGEIAVDTSFLAGGGLSVHSGSKLRVKPGNGILVGDAVHIHYDYLISRLTNFGGSGNIKSAGNYIYTAIDRGLGWGSDGAIYVKSADNTIDVSSGGIKVNTSALPTTTAESFAGDGLIANPEGKLDVYCGSGLDIDKSLGKVIVKSANNSIDVSDNGIKVRTYADQGVFVGNHGVYTRSADSSIGLSTAGIKVNVKSGGGISVGDQGLYIHNISSGIDGVAVDANGGSASASEGGVSIGGYSYAVGPNSVAIGKSAVTSANEAVIIGYNASSLGTSSRSVAVGASSYVGSAYSIAIGGGSKSYSASAIAIGHGSVSNGATSVAIGDSSYTSFDNSIAIGNKSYAYSASAITIGASSYAGSASIAIGIHTQAYPESGVVIGRGSISDGEASVSVGYSSFGSYASVAVGYNSSGSYASAAIGAGSYAGSYYALSAGCDSLSRSEAVAMGAYALSHHAGVAAGYDSLARTAAVSIGCSSRALECGVSSGYQASAGICGVAIGYNASAGVGSVVLGYRASASSGGVAIGYMASAAHGMLCISTSYTDSAGTYDYTYKYGYNGKLYATDTSGGTYTRSWENLLTPPDYSTAVSINANTEYTADRPTYISFNVYAGGTGGYVVAFIKNSVTVWNVVVLYGLTIYNIIPVSKGDTYKLQVTNQGAINPQIYAYRIYPQ